MMVLYFALCVALSTISGTASLTCTKCSNATSLSQCRLTEKCSDGQVCYKKREYTNQVQYSLGCIYKEVTCLTWQGNICVPLKCFMSCGRHATKIQSTSEVSKMNAQQTSYCYECCSTDICNKEICDYRPNSQCNDDVTVDCARLNSLFNICEEKSTRPRRFVHVSATSVIWVLDGSWSPWSSWSSCDVTCGKGSLLRHRSCTNPAPKNGGFDCPGRKTDTKPCFLELCPVHGGWSPWEDWGTCSATCGVGMKSRTRSCTHPSPDRFGNHCFGDSNEAELCKTGPCTRKGKVAFNAYTTNSNGHFREGRVLIFATVTLNDGHGYNSSTGIFKAPVTGVYQFTANVCHPGNKGIIAAIIKGETQIAITMEYTSIHATCSSVSAISRIEENENVFVKVRWSASYLHSDIYRWPSFSGYLLYQDD